MINVIIASTGKDKIHHWIDTLKSTYPLFFFDNIESILSKIKNQDKGVLLVVDAALINEMHQLSLLCLSINKLIVVGENLSPSQQIQYIDEGAWGYADILIKKELIIRAIESVLNSEIWLERQLVLQVIKKVVARQNLTTSHEKISHETSKVLSSLTQREVEVVELVYSGENNGSISEKLEISTRTVKAHLSAVFRKLHVQDRFHLVVLLKDIQLGRLSSNINHLIRN